MTTIPASDIVNVVPSVIDAGGTGLDLGGLMLTNSTRVPVGTIAAFTSPSTVAAYFGIGSAEALAAEKYFNGYNNSPVKPSQLLFVQYPTATVGVPAYLRGGIVSTLTLAQLQATPVGTITLTIDGVAVTSGSINLAAVTSFSDAATAITTALNYFDAQVTAAIAGNTMTVSAVTSGALAVGQVISGAGVTPGTTITALGSGTGGTGTYTVSATQTVASTAIKGGQAVVTYDTIAGAFVITAGTPGAAGNIGFANSAATANYLKLHSGGGGVTSQGAAVGVPATAMAAIIADTQNWATFTTLTKPSVVDMVAFAKWANDQDARYVYVMWDTDITVTTPSAPTAAGTQIIAAGYGSTVPIYTPTNSPQLAAVVMGGIASIDFERVEGRTNLAFRAQDGLLPSVTNKTIADNLIANGYNFYGAYATANDDFVFFYPGSVTGPFEWIDSLVNQIWMNNEFQLALMTLLTSIPSIPYNVQGYALIETTLSDPIAAAVSFGAVRSGVPLSNLQAAQVNSAAGAEVADVITQRGWYLQVAPASPEVRAARGSPPITFWYTDGQSVQKISLNSVEIA